MQHSVAEKRVYVAGIHEVNLGRGNPAPPYRRLVVQAALGAIADAGLEKGAIDGLILCSSIPQPFEWNPAEVAEYLGITPAYVAMLPYGGKPASAVIDMARSAIRAKLAHKVVVIGADNYATTLGIEGAIALLASGLEPQYEQPFGPLIPTAFALMATRYMHEYGTTLEQLAAVAVTARNHARLNPLAEIRDELTIDQVLKARVISSPFTRPMVALISTGGAQGYVVTDEPLGKRSVELLGYGEQCGFMNIMQATSLTEFEHSKRAIGVALREAGVTLDDIKVAELYDPTAIVPIILLEELGFCGRGEGGAFVAEGHAAIGGRLPIITHGGVLSYRHPGMGGPLDNLLEGIIQVRGEAGARQVPNADVGLVHGEGSWLANNSILIFGRT